MDSVTNLKIENLREVIKNNTYEMQTNSENDVPKRNIILARKHKSKTLIYERIGGKAAGKEDEG